MLSALARSGTCACGTHIFGPGSSLSAPSRLSATTPMIWRSGSAANSRMPPRPIAMPVAQGIALGQNCFAMASLMITTGGEAAVSRVGERAPALDRDLEDLEVAGRYRVPGAAAVTGLARGERTADDGEPQAVAAFERHAAGGAGQLHAGDRHHLLDADAHRLLDGFGLQVTVRPSSTSASSARRWRRSPGRRCAAPRRSAPAAPSRSAAPAPGRLRPRPGPSGSCSAGSRCPSGCCFP